MAADDNGNGKFSFSFGASAGGSKPAAAAPGAPMSNMELLLAKAKTPQPATSSKPKPKQPIRFDDDEDETDSLPVASSSKSSKPVPKPRIPLTLDGPPPGTHVKQGTTMSRAEKRLQSEALAIDSTAFQYDEIYDNLKAAERKVEAAKKEETGKRESKYMTAFLESAKRRNMDKLHAEEKMMQIEREKEGGEFDDKEKFVTSAYKAQMEEVRRAEEEERVKEGKPLLQTSFYLLTSGRADRWCVEELRKSKKGPGLTSFYKSMLEDSEAKHAAAVASASGMVDSGPSLAIRPPTSRDYEMDEEAEYDPMLAREAKSSSSNPAAPTNVSTSQHTNNDDRNANTGPKTKSSKYGDDVEINDEGEVVDKRTLLKAGLNIIKKPTVSLPESLKSGWRGPALDGPYQSRAVGSAASHKERMARERRRLEDQMREEEEKKQRLEAERAREEEEEARKRREGDDGEAQRRRQEVKERYLARKRAREQGGGDTVQGEDESKKAKA